MGWEILFVLGVLAAVATAGPATYYSNAPSGAASSDGRDQSVLLALPAGSLGQGYQSQGYQGYQSQGYQGQYGYPLNPGYGGYQSNYPYYGGLSRRPAPPPFIQNLPNLPVIGPVIAFVGNVFGVKWSNQTIPDDNSTDTSSPSVAEGPSEPPKGVLLYRYDGQDVDTVEAAEDSEVGGLDTDRPSVAQVKPSAIALAGVGGLASASPMGTAVVGPGGLAFSAPTATAIAGPSAGTPSELLPGYSGINPGVSVSAQQASDIIRRLYPGLYSGYAAPSSNWLYGGYPALDQQYRQNPQVSWRLQ